MTADELTTLLAFLTGGVLLGFVGHALDVLVAHIRDRN